MAACDPFRQNLKNNLVEDFLDRYSILSDDKWFIGISNIIPWVGATGTTNDNIPPANIDSVKSDTDFWRYALAFKKITKDDVSFVIPRYDWESGKVYTPYRHDIDLYADVEPAQFYVLVDEERVYKCIDNNYDAASIVAPTHTDSQIRTLSDGYRWKFLYSIPETKKKFLTKNESSGAAGYMPVEFIKTINENDDRILQWDVQQAAVNGSIDFISLDENLKNYVISDRVLLYDDANQFIGATSAGASSVVLGGSKIVQQNNYYNGMVLRVESGMGAGQQRVISSYTVKSNGTATVALGSPLNYGITSGTGSDSGRFSILPRILVVGDGSSNNNSLNTYSSTAEVTVKFTLTGASGATGQRYLDTFEMVDGGKNYTYADIQIPLGLTFTPGFTGNFGNLAKAVISPPGGHGSNPVKELGCSALMIVTDFSESESNKVSVQNDYRQFALVQNPELSKKQVHLYFKAAGLSASFAVGATATQGLTAADGTTGLSASAGYILSWTPGTTGTTGTSELKLNNILNGSFKIKGLVSGFEIADIKEKTIAGTEARLLQRLKLTPPTGTTSFNASGTDFTPNYFVVGFGASGSNISASYANGRVYSWIPEAGNNLVGNLYVEHPRGNFSLGEQIVQYDTTFITPSSSKGKIIEIGEDEQGEQTVYDQTTKLNLVYNGVHLFTSSTFSLDSKISSMSGSSENGTGYVVDWTAATGGTSGTLRLCNIYGNVEAGNKVIYTTGATGASIKSILSSPEIKYRTGTVHHIQNIRPITRSQDQKEEIKFIVEF